MSAHGWTGHGHACCRQPGPPVDRPSAVARCGGPVLCGSCGSDAARIHASGTQDRQGAGLLARLAKLEVDHDKLAQDYVRVMAERDAMRARVVLLESELWPARRLLIDEDGEASVACACGAALVGCPGCGEQRCPKCDPVVSASLLSAEVTDGPQVETENVRDGEDPVPGRDRGEAGTGGDARAQVSRQGGMQGVSLPDVSRVASDVQAESARLRPVVAAAKELLRLKDGPRDAAYADQKPHAWAALRSALAPKWAAEGCCRAAYESEGNAHDHPVAGNG